MRLYGVDLIDKEAIVDVSARQSLKATVTGGENERKGGDTSGVSVMGVSYHCTCRDH